MPDQSRQTQGSLVRLRSSNSKGVSGCLEVFRRTARAFVAATRVRFTEALVMTMANSLHGHGVSIKTVP